MVSAAYLESPACREEFLAFEASAAARKVEELLLPVLPLNTPLVTSSSPDPIAKTVERLQYRSLEAGILEGGFDSPKWAALLSGISDDLLAVLGRAESRLFSQEVASSGSSRSVPGPQVPSGGVGIFRPDHQNSEGNADGEDSDELGILDQVVSLEQDLSGLTNSVEAMKLQSKRSVQRCSWRQEWRLFTRRKTGRYGV